MQSKFTAFTFSLLICLIATSSFVLANNVHINNNGLFDSLRDSQRQHNRQKLQHGTSNDKKMMTSSSSSSSSSFTSKKSGYQQNVKFTPLDAKITDPSTFWTPVENPVPNSYLQRPRYPIVPSEGDIAMDILYEVFPNGTIPHVPAKPTNTWLKNLWGFEFNNTQSWGAVYPYPYIVQPRAGQVSLMYPGAPRNMTGNRAMSQGFTYPGPAPPGNPPIYNASYPWLTMAGGFDFAVQILNGMYPKLAKVGAVSGQVDYYSDLGNKTSVGSLYIVKGSPFVTFSFNAAVLELGCYSGPSCPMPPIVGMNGLPPGSKATATRFVFHVAQGPLHPEARKWHVYFSAPVTITLPNPPNQPLQVIGRGPGGSYTGLAKFASGEVEDDENTFLDSIHHTVATGADVEYDVNDAAGKAAVRFRWKTRGPGPLTMLALPHHLRVLPKSLLRNTTSYWCPKGNMTAVTGSVWNMTYNISSVGFGEGFKIDEDKKEVVKAAALFDYEMRIDRCPGDNDTWNGTEGFPGHMNMELYAYVRDLSQYSEIATVLENLGLRSHAVNLTKKVLSCLSWVMKTPNDLPRPCPAPINNTVQCVRDMMDVYYDTKWGGLVTGWFDRFAAHYCQCDKAGGPYACRGYNYCDNPRGWDGFANYGNAFYNDHHFQYGYILRSVAWAVYLQETLGADVGLDQASLKNWTTQALAFARDFANPDAEQDPFFTFLRHKDLFDGHSWAEGYDYSGRILNWINQQSGGEAVNSYFGVYLLGVALNDTNIRDWGRINMATEAFSIHMYQHLTNETSEDRHNPTPEINGWGKCLSILMGNGASGATYYGPNPIFQCGITLLPITPYHKEWIRPQWAREAVEWMKWHDNRTGVCVFFDPLNASQANNNPCPGLNNNKSYTDNAWGCCATNDGYPLNQWRSFPEWYPYIYILEALAGQSQDAFRKLQFTNGFDKPTKNLLFPYVNKFGKVVGFQHDLTLTQALFFVASTKP